MFLQEVCTFQLEIAWFPKVKPLSLNIAKHCPSSSSNWAELATPFDFLIEGVVWEQSDERRNHSVQKVEIPHQTKLAVYNFQRT